MDALAYHGAKNFMNTVFPAVADSQFSGVRLMTPASATPAIAESIRMVLMAIFILDYVLMLRWDFYEILVESANLSTQLKILFPRSVRHVAMCRRYILPATEQ